MVWNRLGKLLGIVTALATVVFLSWQAGELFARRRAEAAKQQTFDDNRQFLVDQREYFRPGSQFPNFNLTNVKDSSTTTLWDELRDGGMMVYLDIQCESCEELMPVLLRALGQMKRPRRVLLVADGDLEAIRVWKEKHNLTLPVFLDQNGFMLSGYDFMIIPAMVVLTPNFEVAAVSTGDWTSVDYVRWLEGAQNQ